MPPYDEIIVRGIFQDHPGTEDRIRLYVFLLPDRRTTTFEIPSDTDLTEEELTQAVCNKFSDVSVKVTIPIFLQDQLVEDKG